MAKVVLKETAMTRVGDVRVGCGNLWEREYTLADGTQTTGLSARLAIGDDVLYVGEGSAIELGGTRYAVTAVDKVAGELGLVTLESA